VNVYYPPKYRQWALVLDCEQEGCDPKHRDDGSVTLHDPRDGANVNTRWQKINGHAARLVTRVMPEWEEV
jgi:hypothetical protein